MRDYTYAAARIKALESGLLSAREIDGIIQSGSYDELVSLLDGRGYIVENGIADIARAEREMWDLICELADKDVVRVLRTPQDYFNIKVAVRCAFRNIEGEQMLARNGNEDADVLYDVIASGDFDMLGGAIRECVETAYDYLFRTGDGAGTDIIIDKAMLERMWHGAVATRDKYLIRYIEILTDLYNIKAILRCLVRNADSETVTRAIIPLGTLKVRRMGTVIDTDGLRTELAATPYSRLCDVLDKTEIEFEKRCEEFILSQLLCFDEDIFSLAPILYYLKAKEREFKLVRILTFGIRNNLSESLMRARV